MSDIFEFVAETRTETGKAAARRLRRVEDKIPAVVYGKGKPAVSLNLMHKDVLKSLEYEAVYSHILTLKIDGKAEKVVLKDILRHPSKPKIMHVDFFRVSSKEKLTMNVPLHFEGEDKSPGLKADGVLSKLLTDLEISCLPSDLPEFITVDISGLDIGDSVHLSEVALPKGVELEHPVEDEEHDHAVVSVHPPVAEEPEETEESEKDADEEAAADAEKDSEEDSDEKSDEEEKSKDA